MVLIWPQSAQKKWVILTRNWPRIQSNPPNWPFFAPDLGHHPKPRTYFERKQRILDLSPVIWNWPQEWGTSLPWSHEKWAPKDGPKMPVFSSKDHFLLQFQESSQIIPGPSFTILALLPEKYQATNEKSLENDLALKKRQKRPSPPLFKKKLRTL